MSYNIDINTQSDLWDKYAEPLGESCAATIDKVLDYHKLSDNNIEISLTLSDDEEITALNADYRSKDATTNVLSFPIEEFTHQELNTICKRYNQQNQPFMLGDEIFAFETIEKEASEQNKSFLDHFTHLLVHSTLHLLGYNHIEDEEADFMEALEIKLLAELGIKNPYE